MAKVPLTDNLNWQQPQNLPARKFTCGHCDQGVASNRGWGTPHPTVTAIVLCPLCDRPTFFYGASQNPGVAFGRPVAELPDGINHLFEQARVCCSAGAYTGAVLLLRKLLMHVAVDQKAPENQSFVSYVEYLATAGYVPPNGRAWVDHIRKRGNEATHEIVIMADTDAKELIVFSEMLLKFIYEFPNQVPRQP
jgi:hypothetical protein